MPALFTSTLVRGNSFAIHSTSVSRPSALLAWAREDKYFKVKLAQRLMERLPQGRLELIDDSYTFVSLDQPERLATLIREFVQSTSHADVASGA